VGEHWDVGHLRAGLAATGVLAAPGVPLALWLGGATGALCVLAGLAVVAAFFSLSTLAVAWAGRVGGDGMTLPAAMSTYALKILLLGVLLVRTRDQEWMDTSAFGWSVLAGTLCWTVVHARRVWTTRMYYVDPSVLDRVEARSAQQEV
jgi:hypothetical protein